MVSGKCSGKSARNYRFCGVCFIGGGEVLLGFFVVLSLFGFVSCCFVFYIKYRSISSAETELLLGLPIQFCQGHNYPLAHPFQQGTAVLLTFL